MGDKKNMTHFEDMRYFIAKQTRANAEEIQPNTDIHEDLNVTGDDYDELMQAYQQNFEVDMTGYIWYFHHAEEGNAWSWGGYFFKRPNERVVRIPVTLTMLTEFANNRKWGVNYPEHSIPKTRWDIVINWAFTLLFVIVLIWKYVF